MEIILVIFTLCGDPVYVVGESEHGPIVGTLSNAPQRAVEQLYDIIHTKGALVLERPLESLTGTVCV